MKLLTILACCLAAAGSGQTLDPGYHWSPNVAYTFEYTSPNLMKAMRKSVQHGSTLDGNPLKLVAKVKVQAFGDMTLRVKLDQIRFYSNGNVVNLDKAHQILRDETSNQFGMVHNDKTFKKMLTAPFLLHIKRGVVKKMIVSRNEPAEVTEIKKLLASNLEKKSGQVHLQLLMKTAIIIPLETPRFPMKIDIDASTFLNAEGLSNDESGRKANKRNLERGVGSVATSFISSERNDSLALNRDHSPTCSVMCPGCGNYVCGGVDCGCTKCTDGCPWSCDSDGKCPIKCMIPQCSKCDMDATREDLISSIHNVEECKQECMKNASCVGIDFGNVNRKCYLNFGTFKSWVNHNDFNSWKKNPACDPKCTTNSDCGQNAECKADKYALKCVCSPGYVGDPYTRCDKPNWGQFCSKTCPKGCGNYICGGVDCGCAKCDDSCSWSCDENGKCPIECMNPMCSNCDMDTENCSPYVNCDIRWSHAEYSVEECKQSCIKDKGCVGIDFGVNGRKGECWLNYGTLKGKGFQHHNDFNSWKKNPACVECKSDFDCKAEKPYCAKFGRCVECLNDNNCRVKSNIQNIAKPICDASIWTEGGMGVNTIQTETCMEDVQFQKIEYKSCKNDLADLRYPLYSDLTSAMERCRRHSTCSGVYDAGPGIFNDDWYGRYYECVVGQAYESVSGSCIYEKKALTCIDKSTDCAYWKSVGYCNSAQYASYMKKNCASTCNTCEKEGTYIGCYVDDDNRDLKDGPKKYGYNQQTCNIACQGYTYYSLQNFGWCACGNGYATKSQYVKKPDSECGGARRLGGQWRNSVYKTRIIEGTSVKVLPELGKSCSSEGLFQITTESDCKAAAIELGLTWGSSWNGKNEMPGCVYAEDSRKKVYFNTSPKAGWDNPYNKAHYASICKDLICPREQGYCVTSTGGDQNSGVTKLNSLDGNTLERQEQCLELCKSVQGVTGCEVIWDQESRGCYAHTQEIAFGNGVARHFCWVFSKCRVRQVENGEETLVGGSGIMDEANVMDGDSEYGAHGMRGGYGARSEGGAGGIGVGYGSGFGSDDQRRHLVDTARPRNSASIFGCNGNKIALATRRTQYIEVSSDQVNISAKGVTSRMINTQFEVIDIGYGRFALKNIHGKYLAASAPKHVQVLGILGPDIGAVFQLKKSRYSGYYMIETERGKYLKANDDDSLTADGSMHDDLANFKPECIKGEWGQFCSKKCPRGCGNYNCGGEDCGCVKCDWFCPWSCDKNGKCPIAN